MQVEEDASGTSHLQGSLDVLSDVQKDPFVSLSDPGRDATSTSPLTSPPLSPSAYADYMDMDFNLDVVEEPIYLLEPLGETWMKRWKAIQSKKQQLETWAQQKKLGFKNKQVEFKSKVQERKLKLKRALRAQRVVRFRDKITFVSGVTNIWLTIVVMLCFPFYMPLYFTVCSICLISLRYSLYKPKRWHYFLGDLCYNVNALTMLFLHILPHSKWLFISIFCLSHGPVTWAIYAWRNSLVFHSIDKVTSIWIHFMPALTLYTVRWLAIPLDRRTERSIAYPAFSFDPNHPTSSVAVSFKEAMVGSLTAYLVWQALYYYFIQVRQAEKLKQRLRVTSFTWLVDDYMKNKKSNYLTRLFLKFDASYHVWLFMGVQLIYALLTLLPTVVYYHSFAVHTAYIVCVFMMSVFNGADYYIEVFSRRYRMELEKLDRLSTDLEESLLEATFGCSSRAGKSENPSEQKEGDSEDDDMIRPISVKDILPAVVQDKKKL